MRSNVNGSVVGSFNARNSSPYQVARSFVFTGHFETLSGNSHAILIGPRGSGKTTLLKMLQVGAIRVWADDNADRLAGQIGAVGVYVPADSAWSTHLHSISKFEESNAQVANAVAEAALTNHVLQAFVRALDERRSCHVGEIRSDFLRVEVTPELEADVVRALSRVWKLTPVLPTIQALREALAERHCLIGSLADTALVTPNTEDWRKLVETYPFLAYKISPALSAGIEVVNGRLGEEHRQWAVLFDELEILPDVLQRNVLQLLRSTDQRVLFKIAISPHTAQWEALLQKAGGPQDAQDYVSIRLWYTDRRRMEDFSGRLLEQQVLAAGLDVKTAVDLLGSSGLFGPDDGQEARAENYRKDGRFALAFAELEKQDAGFRDFLTAKGISPDALDPGDGAEYGSLVRKIAPMVAWRLFFTKQGNENETVGRSRKILPYTGKEALIAITEGNPRWIMALASALLDVASRTKTRPLPAKDQSDEVQKITSRFSAMLRTAPIGNIPGVPHGMSVLKLLDSIGSAMKWETVTGPFKSDPASSWVFDDKRQDWEEALLKQALNLGGIVYLPEDRDPDSLSSLQGRRFRLAYTLAPRYSTPLRSTKSAQLSALLFGDSVTPDMFSQLDGQG